MPTLIPKHDEWGPYRPDLKPAELVACCRSLRALVHVLTGKRGDAVCRLLRIVETLPDATDALALSLVALGQLAALDKRHVWSSYAALTRPEPV